MTDGTQSFMSEFSDLLMMRSEAPMHTALALAAVVQECLDDGLYCPMWALGAV